MFEVSINKKKGKLNSLKKVTPSSLFPVPLKMDKI